jgi:hypothetical protein
MQWKAENAEAAKTWTAAAYEKAEAEAEAGYPKGSYIWLGPVGGSSPARTDEDGQTYQRVPLQAPAGMDDDPQPYERVAPFPPQQDPEEQQQQQQQQQLQEQQLQEQQQQRQGKLLNQQRNQRPIIDD